ncbi:MerR family transcriptional regulator [Cryptosporangium arvum]|uniref:Putative transcriptional regulator n=1 Tax=Cryptosporangium arvum DSM 44712 TaxID=927661 RepID=A0A010ZYR2_9ACTN|nr:MerR family transcriptional regulator [Cryptosporangium arvum]EXG82342.1 putative transcriptional regulator [Cryptosporangium arvum DSM 44712]
MAWSTRELAELAGTTVNAIRHYHRIGLLEEPQRRQNGYKQYGDEQLVRLRRIRLLVELGVPLARIAELGLDEALAPAVLREIDADHSAEVERLQRARCAIAVLLRDEAPSERSSV